MRNQKKIKKPEEKDNKFEKEIRMEKIRNTKIRKSTIEKENINRLVSVLTNKSIEM